MRLVSVSDGLLTAAEQAGRGRNAALQKGTAMAKQPLAYNMLPLLLRRSTACKT